MLQARCRLPMDCPPAYSVSHYLVSNCIRAIASGKVVKIVRSFRLPAVALVMSATVLTGSLMAGAASSAGAAARTATVPVISVSGTGRPAVALRAALDSVRRTNDGQLAPASAGLSSRTRSADSALVTAMNKVERQAGALDLADVDAVDAAYAIPTAGQSTTVIMIVPGTTLTISSTEVVLDISPQDVTDIEGAADLGSGIASLVGAILDLTGVGDGDAIAEIVASSLEIGSDALKLCTSNDGGSLILSLTVSRDELPSVSACGVSV
jgi:hypothetical protein